MDRVVVENNYLSSTEKSRQTELSHKQNLTPEEQHDLDVLNRKDAETSKQLIDACMNGSASACTAARKDAQEKQDSYKNLGYQNTKEGQAGYQQIQQLLNGTSAEAKQTQELFNGMVAAYMRTGMSEDAAKSAVGYQLGAMYVVGGIAGIGGGKAVDEGLIPGVKPSSVTGKSGSSSKGENKPSSSAENTQPLKASVLDEKKFDYLFGRASGGKHNLDRTNQLALEMKRLGVIDDTNGRSIISEHFNSITKNPNNIVKQYTDQYGSFEVRESFFIGPSGKATTFESTFEVMPDSSHRFITTIPKNGATK